MKKQENIFGKGYMYNEEDLGNKVYITCAACMSVWTDALSWANNNRNRIVKTPWEADDIVVLGCQVTDLAIMADLKVAARMNEKYTKNIYMGGCIAQRFDITLPDYIRRLDVIRVKNQELSDMSLVNFEKPYWVNDFEETDEELAQGNLFRKAYPLKIGAGCDGKCKYCTIRHTRSDKYEIPPIEQIKEFLEHDNVVLISDNPTKAQIIGWCKLATIYNKQISIRNIEPLTVVQCEKELIDLSQTGLLRIFHCPIQSFDPEILQAMNRGVENTLKSLEIMKILRANGTIVATNIIIDYTISGQTISNWDKERLEKEFDYYSWNPYWDGNWDLENAEKRYTKYLKNDRIKV